MELVKHLSGLRQARTDPTGARTVSTNNGRIARELRSDARGLLLIYPLDPKPENGIVNLDTDGPVMGFAISFPVSERARPIEYIVNEVYLSLTEAYEFEDDADDDL
jgi:hypothetical protein